MRSLILFLSTEDGYYEIARYRMYGNGEHRSPLSRHILFNPSLIGSAPQCITGVMNWCHGTFQYVSNGSIIMTPFGDGFQQIQSPCAATSNFLQNYNDTELYLEWIIYQDPTLGFVLQMYQFDGSPLPLMTQVSKSPNMLPTVPLRNVSSESSNISKRSTNDAPPIGRWATASIIALGGLLGSALLVLA